MFIKSSNLHTQRLTFCLIDQSNVHVMVVYESMDFAIYVYFHSVVELMLSGLL